MISIAELTTLFILLFLTIGLYHIGRARTPPFRNSLGRVRPNSIASLEPMNLGGQKQFVLIRGRNRTHPLLLFLHGGPGMPVMYLAHRFQKTLEDHFVVVHWDRRGAGKSYNKDVPLESMNVEQMIADTYELVQYLERRFAQERIYLIGHSWGTYLGMLVVYRHPELFHAYVGVGQLTGKGHDSQEIAAIQERFIRQCALETNNQAALQELDSPGGADREKWLFRFGGELRKATNFWPLLLTGFQAPEYNLRDIRNVIQGSNFTQRHMKYNAMSEPLIERVTSVEIPVYFFTGRYDYTDPFELTEQYFERLAAPIKRMVWFEESAHFPFFEESDRFTEEMLKVLSETQPGDKSA